MSTSSFTPQLRTPDIMPRSMRAVQLTRVGRPLEMVNLPTPRIRANEVLVKILAAGICHSDVHYRAGNSRVEPLPLTLGHEIAGEVVAVGDHVLQLVPGDRVCLHYLLICEECQECLAGREQFCEEVLMLGHYINGGWAEYIAVPARNAVKLPDLVSMEHGAVMMCSSATALHALRKGRLAHGEHVLVVGTGGLGLSAIQIAYALGAKQVIALDQHDDKLELAEHFGATTINTRGMSIDEVVAVVQSHTNGRGVDVSLEFVGKAETVQTALKCVAPLGRAVVVGLNNLEVPIDTYADLIGREAELIGSNDHLLSELEELTVMASTGQLKLDRIVQKTVPLDPVAIGDVLDRLTLGQAPARTVVIP